MEAHKGWHDRGYLPHLDAEGMVQHIVFRLHGSLPASLLEQAGSESDQQDDRRLAIDHALDLGHGPTWLSDPGCADIVAEAITRFDGSRYDLKAWCVMPNHVHVMIRQTDGWPLGPVIKSWKGYTARMINRRLGRQGTLWAADYFDRYVRNDEQHVATIAYIEANPVKAGLCAQPEDWRWSSAGARAARFTDFSPADLEVRAPAYRFER